MRIIFWISWFTFLLVIIRLQYQVNQVMKQMAADHAMERFDRAAAIVEIKRTADVLAKKTAAIAEAMKQDTVEAAAQIAETVKEDTLARAHETAQGIDVKIEKLLARFDEASEERKDIKAELQKEKPESLEQSEEKAKARAQADSIQETGEESNRILKDEKPE